MDSYFFSFWIGFTGLLGYFFPGFPEESPEIPI